MAARCSRPGGRRGGGSSPSPTRGSSRRTSSVERLAGSRREGEDDVPCSGRLFAVRRALTVDRERRLRAAYDIREARARGKAYAAGPIVARIHPNRSDPAKNRYAIIAGKKVGKAHERNRCKRLIREAARALDPSVTPGHDVVFILRGGVDELTGLAVADDCLRQIFRRARLLAVEPGPATPAADATGDAAPA